jgi:hypothetical protein
MSAMVCVVNNENNKGSARRTGSSVSSLPVASDRNQQGLNPNCMAQEQRQ